MEEDGAELETKELMTLDSMLLLQIHTYKHMNTYMGACMCTCDMRPTVSIRR